MKTKITPYLERCINRSIKTLREMNARFENPCMLWAGGKDSTTLLNLARAAFFKEIPFPVVFIDTGWKFRETYDFITYLKNLWKLPLKVITNTEARIDNVSPETHTKMRCCTYLKTIPLRDFIIENNIDAIAVAIRADEHPARGKELVFAERFDPPHTRVHAILHWSLEDIWDYINTFHIPKNPLYDRVIIRKGVDYRYKSIGCWTCTEPVPKEALERAGRAQDKESEAVMERLRALGYM